MNQSLRYFLKRGLKEYLAESYTLFRQESQTSDESREESLDSYFSSDEACQALLSEYTFDDLREDARNAGINPDGLSKRELARKIFAKSKGL